MTALDSTGFQYDHNGNTTKDDVLTNTYTYRNELLTSSDGVNTLSFTYDHNGERTTDSDGTIINYYPNKYYNELNAVVTKNIYMDDTLVATVEGSGGSARYFYNHTDHLTGSNVTTNGSGALEQTLDYMPFGEIRLNDQVNTFDQKYKFAGSVYDEETELSYMGSRYQNGRLGRFISEDPVFLDIGDEKKVKEATNKSLTEYLSDPQRLNSYSYAGNNPLKNIDPNGMDYLEIGASFTGLISSVNFGYKIDFKNSRLDLTYGAGVGTGTSADISALYSFDNLPSTNNYLTEELSGTAAYGLAVKGTKTSMYTVDNPNNINNDTGISFGLGTGFGLSGSFGLNHNVTLVDLSSNINKFKLLYKTMDKVVESVKSLNKELKENNKSKK